MAGGVCLLIGKAAAFDILSFTFGASNKVYGISFSRHVPFKERFPVLPVPLVTPDKDVPLDLQRAFHEIYRKAAYHLSIDYEAMPPPEFSASDLAWIHRIKVN